MDARRRWLVLGVLGLPLFGVVLNNSVLNVAVPALMRDLGATTSTVQWIVDTYSLVFAGLLITAGGVADRYGRKRVTLTGLAVFGAASIAASLADGAPALIAARAAMGLGAAMVMPGTLAILVDVFPPAERAKAIAAWGSIAALGVAAGPVLGGLLVGALGWSSVFLVNVPLALVTIGLGLVLLPESSDPEAGRPDLGGALLSTLATSAFVYAVITVPGAGWTARGVWGALGLSALAAAGFVAWERRQRHPLLDLRLLRDRRFSGAALSGMLLVFGLSGTLFVLTQHLQLALGYSPLRAGLAVAPVAVAVGAASSVAPAVSRRFGQRAGVGAGLTVVASGILVIGWAPGGYPPVLGGLLLMGCGFGLALTPATDALMSSLPPERSGTGSALSDTMQELGYALGVAVTGSVLTAVYARDLTARAGEVAEAARSSLAAALDLGLGGPARQAFAVALPLGLTVGACVVLLGAACALALLPGRLTGPAVVADDTRTPPIPAREGIRT
ncbi:MFS transporter [Microbispora sp. NPDC049125]|uniref:MFS transporter n=1 Tax=Microbispora sp. NPDC049125 TaxID=3154929 RepID=UPI00346640A3